MTDFGGKTSIFSHPVYLFLRKFSLQDSRGGSYRLISIVVSEFTGREHIYTIPETEEDDFDIPF
ncbi:hypothetical protein ACN82_21295 [Escherichia coli]|nr:hypothetical protein ACN82_21295 [Escherichia coli]